MKRKRKKGRKGTFTYVRLPAYHRSLREQAEGKPPAPKPTVHITDFLVPTGMFAGIPVYEMPTDQDEIEALVTRLHAARDKTTGEKDT